MNIWTGGKRRGRPTKTVIFISSILRTGSADGNTTLSDNGSTSCITNSDTLFTGQMRSEKPIPLPIEWSVVSIFDARIPLVCSELLAGLLVPERRIYAEQRQKNAQQREPLVGRSREES